MSYIPVVMGQPDRPYIGGQAVLEGVMMRSPTSFAIVVRRHDGSLSTRERPMTDTRRGWAKLPMVRGVYSLVEALRLGHEALRFSGDHFERDLEVAAGAGLSVLSAFGLSLFSMVTREPAPPSAETPDKPADKRGIPGAMVVLMLVFMVVLPQAAAAGAARLAGLDLEVQSPGFQALTGLFKLSIVLAYLLLIRRVAEIRRVFQYHGAEHKTISTYEAREPLDVVHARTKTTLHPRCGTTFLVMVVLVSIVLFTVLGAALRPIWSIHTGSVVLDNLAFFAVKLPILPVLVGVTFELQRVLARWCTTGPLRALLWPGFLVQKITTIEPDDAQLEVAIASLALTLRRERGEVSGSGGDADYAGLRAVLEP